MNRDSIRLLLTGAVRDAARSNVIASQRLSDRAYDIWAVDRERTFLPVRGGDHVEVVPSIESTE